MLDLPSTQTEKRKRCSKILHSKFYVQRGNFLFFARVKHHDSPLGDCHFGKHVKHAAMILQVVRLFYFVAYRVLSLRIKHEINTCCTFVR